MNIQKINLISTYAIDKVIDISNSISYERLGGPANWIKDEFERNNQDYLLHTSIKTAFVEIEVNNFFETGRIVSLPKIPKPNKKLNFNNLCLISTVGDEFDLITLLDYNGPIVIDIQGYVRSEYFKDVKLKEIYSKFAIIKATKKEFDAIPPDIKQTFLKKVCLITDGERGFSVINNNTIKIYKSNRVENISNTIGAGDTFIAAFCIKYLCTNDVYSAADFAQKRVELFLKNKK